MPWCGMPPRSSSVGLAVPTSIPRYTERESIETISPPSRRATSIESAVFPDAVGPTMASASGGAADGGPAAAVTARAAGSSAPPEAAVQLGERELHHRRPAVDVVVGEL